MIHAEEAKDVAEDEDDELGGWTTKIIYPGEKGADDDDDFVNSIDDQVDDEDDESGDLYGIMGEKNDTEDNDGRRELRSSSSSLRGSSNKQQSVR